MSAFLGGSTFIPVHAFTQENSFIIAFFSNY